MSDAIKHECGIALVRLLKPISYYCEKYGTALYGFNKLFLLMEKQHNRGQDGAGIGAVKIGVEPGKQFMFRERSTKSSALSVIFGNQLAKYQEMVKDGTIHPEFPATVKENFDFCAELLIGHLRYGTSGQNDKALCHPFFRKSTWPSRNVMLVGNFNITNTDELNRKLIERGTHPIFSSDTQAIMEEICYHLDMEHSEIYRNLRDEGYCGDDVLKLMADYNLDAMVYPHQQQLVCKVGEAQKERNGVLCSVTGFPSIAVPAGFAKTLEAPIGVPVGMEIIGRPFSEPVLIEIAYGYEQKAQVRRPPVL